MVPKFLIFLLFITLTLNHSSKLSFAQAKSVIHIISAFPSNNASHVNIQVTANKTFMGTFELSHPGQEYRLKVNARRSVYYVIALYGLKFASFHAYDPTRDKRCAAIYWRVDDWGFHISYDKANWQDNAAWESE